MQVERDEISSQCLEEDKGDGRGKGERNAISQTHRSPRIFGPRVNDSRKEGRKEGEVDRAGQVDREMRQGSHAFVTSRASTLFHAHQPRERLENFTAKRKSRLGSSPGALISGFDVDYGLRLSRAFKSRAT